MNPRPPDPEILVVGGGAAGFYCALSAAKEGYRTVLVEQAELGGTAFRWGCLPVKAVLDQIRARRGSGAARRIPRGLLSRTARSIGDVEVLMRRRLEAAGVEVLIGPGSFVGQRDYRLGERRLRAKSVVLATGTTAVGLPALPLDGSTVLSHREVFAAGEVPRRLLIVGADVEGVEFAALFSALGSRVVLAERERELLPGLDRDLAEPVERALREQGVRFELGVPVAGAKARRRGAAVELADGRHLAADRVLVTGVRKANIPAGLEQTGVSWDREHIQVDPSLATACPGIYAIGDVNGLLGMGHAAIQQGTLLPRSLRAGRALDGAPWRSYRCPPRAIYTLPEIAGAGATERELQRAATPYRATRVDLRDTWRGLWRPANAGFLKLLTGEAGEVLGVWISAPEAAEAAALFGVLLERKPSANELAGSLVTHPTLGEALREAAFRAVAGA